MLSRLWRAQGCPSQLLYSTLSWIGTMPGWVPGPPASWGGSNLAQCAVVLSACVNTVPRSNKLQHNVPEFTHKFHVWIWPLCTWPTEVYWNLIFFSTLFFLSVSKLFKVYSFLVFILLFWSPVCFSKAWGFPCLHHIASVSKVRFHFFPCSNKAILPTIMMASPRSPAFTIYPSWINDCHGWALYMLLFLRGSLNTWHVCYSKLFTSWFWKDCIASL